jgi:hypothetical protein
VNITSSSSSFIKPPANGHHRWSGAGKKNNIFIIFYNFLQYWQGILQSNKQKIYDGVDWLKPLTSRGNRGHGRRRR